MAGESNPLIEAWIKRYETIEKNGNEATEAKALFWVYEEVDNICTNTPDLALKLIIQILASTQNEYVLANLAAGPLETLLSYHGEKIIGEVEAYAKSNVRFNAMLQNVWQNRMDDHTWGRILKAVEPTSK